MQMIDVLKRLAELDAQNPNMVSEVSKELATKAYNKMSAGDDPWKNRTGLAGDQSDRLKARMDKRWGKDKVDAAVQKSREQGVGEGLEECGMMGGMSSQPHSPASINMTAATGEELSSMLKDIMTLAGRQMQEPIGGEEPMGGADGIAVVDMEPSGDVGVEPSPEVGADEPSLMRSMIDKLNPSDDDQETDNDQDDEESDDQDDEEQVEEYDNSPEPTTSGYDAAVPSGNDLHKEKEQFPATQRGDNPMAVTYESLMSEYKKFANKSDETVITNENAQHSHQYDVTMKHADKPTVQQRMAAHDIKPGIAGYRDRIDMLHDLERTGKLKDKDVDEVSQKNFNPHNDLAGRGRLSSFNKTDAGKKADFNRGTERLKDKMAFTKSQGGVTGPKGPLPEMTDLKKLAGLK